MQKPITIDSYTSQCNPIAMLGGGLSGGIVGCFFSAVGYLSFSICFPGAALLGVIAIPVFSNIAHRHVNQILGETIHNSKIFSIDAKSDLDKYFPQAPIGSIFINTEAAKVHDTPYEVIYKADEHTQLKWKVDRKSRHGQAIGRYKHTEDTGYTLKRELLLEKHSYINNYFYKRCVGNMTKPLCIGVAAFLATAITVILLSFPPTTALGILAATALVFIAGSALYGIESYRPSPKISTNKSSSFQLKPLADEEPADELMQQAEISMTAT